MSVPTDFPKVVVKEASDGNPRGLFAARNLAKGEVVMKVSPPKAFAALNDSIVGNPDPSQNRCSHCYHKQDDDDYELLRCAGCKFLVFCGKVS